MKKDARAAHSTVRGSIATGLAGLSLLLVPAICAAEGSAVRAKGGSADAAVATLSNLKTLPPWAYLQEAAAVHLAPSAGSPVVDHLRFLTVDGQAEVYLALRSYSIGQVIWVLVPIPGRPNGATGWVPASAL